MSLDVSPALLEQAERGEVDEAEFVDCVRTSLPYAWEMISSLRPGCRWTGVRSPTTGRRRRTSRRGQLRAPWRVTRSAGAAAPLRRAARVPELPPRGVFPLDPSVDERLARFTSVRAQLLNQSPELRDC